MSHETWRVPHLNIAVLLADGRSFRKAAWLTTRSGGIYCGWSFTVAVSFKLSYHADGSLYRELSDKTSTREEFPPIKDIKGLVQFYAGGGTMHEFLRDFPFERIDEAVYIDTHRRGAYNLNFGLLAPGAFNELEKLHQFGNIHIHVITRTDPHIVIWTGQMG